MGSFVHFGFFDFQVTSFSIKTFVIVPFKVESGQNNDDFGRLIRHKQPFLEQTQG
jgi:hypothetical protein